MIKYVTLAFIYTFIFCVARAAPQKYDKETEIAASPNSKFTISSGWTFDDKTKKLTSPEGDLII